MISIKGEVQSRITHNFKGKSKNFEIQIGSKIMEIGFFRNKEVVTF